MVTFRPTVLSESWGLGQGIAAAYGHSLLMKGQVWEGFDPKGSDKPFCDGNVRILKTDGKDASIGMFRLGPEDVDDANGPIHLTAVIFVSESQFLSARSILLQGPDHAQIQIEWENLRTIEDVAKTTRHHSLSIASASVSSRYWTATFSNKKYNA